MLINLSSKHVVAWLLTCVLDSQVMIHPSSVNNQLAIPEPHQGQGHPCHVVLYDEVTRGESQLYVRQCTAASPHALLMVAAHLGVSQDEDDGQEEEQPSKQT